MNGLMFAASIILTWGAPQGVNYDSYNVFYGTDSANLDQNVTVGDTQVQIDGLTEGATYFFAVQGVDSTTQGPLSDQLEVAIDKPAIFPPTFRRVEIVTP